MSQRYYMNVKNRYKTSDGSKFCILWSFLLGPFYFAIRGNWKWFFIWLLFTPFSFWVVPFFTRRINRMNLIMKGYRQCQK